MNLHYDVIIIGAGPAGLSCAKHLIKNGIKPLIIEKKKLPRIKCCSGLISERAFSFIKENFGEIPSSVYCENKEQIISSSYSGKKFIPLDINFTNVFRDKLEEWLVSQVNTEIIEQCTLLSVTEEDKSVKITVKKKKDDITTLSCDYLIGADGANSTVRKNIDPDFDINNLMFGYQQVYLPKTNPFGRNAFHLIKNPKYTDEFAWIHCKNEFVFIGTGYFTKNNKEKKYLAAFNEFIKNQFSFEENPIRNEGSYIPIFYNGNGTHWGTKKILLTGESAGLIGLFGEGMTSAFISGKSAAEAIFTGAHYSTLIKPEYEYLTAQWNNSSKKVGTK